MHLHYSFTSSLFFCLANFTQISHAKVNGFTDSSFGTVDECKIIQGSGNCPCSDTNLLRGSLESVAERATLTVSPPPPFHIMQEGKPRGELGAFLPMERAVASYHNKYDTSTKYQPTINKKVVLVVLCTKTTPAGLAARSSQDEGTKASACYPIFNPFVSQRSLLRLVYNCFRIALTAGKYECSAATTHSVS